MAGGMQKLVLCFAQRFLALRLGITELLCVRMVDRLGKRKLALMFECMAYPIQIKAPCANTGHQHDQYYKAERVLEKKWATHETSLARQNHRVTMPAAVPTVFIRRIDPFHVRREHDPIVWFVPILRGVISTCHEVDVVRRDAGSPQESQSEKSDYGDILQVTS